MGGAVPIPTTGEKAKHSVYSVLLFFKIFLVNHRVVKPCAL